MLPKPLNITLLSLLLVVTFTAAKYGVLAWQMPQAEYGMRRACRQPALSPLLVGSSMFRKGIYAPTYGDSAFLLAYNGNQPAYEALQLRWMLDHGAHIERLVLDLYPYSAVRPAALSDTRMLLDGDQPYALQVYRRVGDPTQRSLAAAWKLIVQSNNEMLLTWPLSFPLVNARYRRGANDGEVAGCNAEQLDAAVAEEMQAVQSHLHPDQQEGLRQIIALCRQHDIRLLFLETPKYHRVYRDSVFTAIMADYAAFLAAEGQTMVLTDTTRQLVAAQLPPEARVVTYDFPYGDASLFSDLIHLSSAGRRALSDSILPLLQ